MDFPSKRLIPFILVSSLNLLTCTGDDKIRARSSISANETIVSAGEKYALGFYNTPNSSNWYVAIWFYKIPVQTISWVANRETPLPDSAGKLSVTADGNLEIANVGGTTIWSTNITASGANRTAMLQDTGNLVLTEPNSTIVWQSFEQPAAATMLSGMHFYLNLKTNTSRRALSWKSATDPSPGEFSAGIDPTTPRQLQVLRGSTTYWRENTWFKELSASKPEADRNYVVYLSTLANDDEVYYTFTVSSEEVFVRYFLTPVGHIELQAWRDDTQKWKVLWSSQQSNCDIYGRCGPFASCDYNSSQAACKCLEGFVPRVQREWDAGNWSSGCVRRTALQCTGGGRSGVDGFLELESTKMPDFSVSVGNISVTDCEQACSRNCSCAAYAYTNVSGWRSSNCLIWVGNLSDVVSNFGKTVIFLRLASSELGKNITQGANSPSTDKKNLPRILIPTIIGGTLFLFAFGFLLRQRIKRTGMRQNEHEINLMTAVFATGEGASELPFFTFRSIVYATDNFSTANKLGEGGFGPVYKGRLSGGQEVAVKRLSKSSGQGIEELKNEVKLIARLQHRNLVRLLGWCVHQEEKILIYEYMPNKSLDKFLFAEPVPGSALNWGTRFRIIEGISQGLLYLHRHSRLRIIHRDLKTGNILLDGEMNPKISDFGLARIVEGDQSKVNTKKVAGTYGYMAPEYALDGIFSEKSDVYSYGVLLLEIVSGKKNTGFYSSDELINLPGYAWQLWEEGRALALVDPTVGDSCISQQAIRCIHVGLLCVQEDPKDRPTMSSVVFMFGSETANPPKPKQPAFSTKKTPIAAVSSEGSPIVSNNWVTITELEPK